MNLTIRNVAFISYDLQIANIPLTLDINNENQLALFMGELLSEYNDKTSMQKLVSAIIKMLDDTVYNEPIKAICYHQISKSIVKQIKETGNFKNSSYYKFLWQDSNSVCNKGYPQKKPYIQAEILKLTFTSDERSGAMGLFYKLDQIKGTYVGYYDRFSGERTILVSISKKAVHHGKIAFRILKEVVSFLRHLPNTAPEDKLFLLVVNFFYFIIFNNVMYALGQQLMNKNAFYVQEEKRKV